MSLSLKSTSNTFTTEVVEGDKAETIAPIVSGTAVTATGTSVTFTGIPTWAKRVTVMFFGLSTTGTSPVTIRVGTAGGVVTTGYSSITQGYAGTAVATTDSTSGFQVEDAGQAAFSRYGTFTIDRVSGNNWVMKGNQWRATNTGSQCTGGIGLAAALDRISVTTNGGTETFDAGSINIMWE